MLAWAEGASTPEDKIAPEVFKGRGESLREACARAFMRTLAKHRELKKFGEVWRTRNTIFMRTYLTFTRVPVKVSSVHGWPSECAQQRVVESLRDGEMTIKIKFAVFAGGGVGGREENRPKTLSSWETP